MMLRKLGIFLAEISVAKHFCFHDLFQQLRLLLISKTANLMGNGKIISENFLVCWEIFFLLLFNEEILLKKIHF